MCGRWGIAEPHIAVILYILILHCLISEFSKKVAHFVCWFRKIEKFLLLIFKNEAFFSKMKQFFLSEFSRTPSKKCDYFTKSGASVSRAAHDPGGGLDSETSGARLWGSMAITPGSLVTTTTGGSQDTWFRATKTFKTSTPLFWMAYPADTKQWKTTTLSNLPQVWFSGRAWIPGDPTLFFLMSQQCLNENFQECCNMFRCSGSRPTFDIWHFKTTTFSNEIFRRGAWIQDGVAPDPVRRSKFELLNFWNLQKIKSMFAGAWMGPRWI